MLQTKKPPNSESTGFGGLMNRITTSEISRVVTHHQNNYFSFIGSRHGNVLRIQLDEDVLGC